MLDSISISEHWSDQDKMVHFRGHQMSRDVDRLEFPKDIADTIGVRKETINFWKKRGCRFMGRKTTITWVRDFMGKETGGLDYGIS